MSEGDIDEGIAHYQASPRFSDAEKVALRYSELMALEVPWLKLDAERPYIAVPAEIQKVQKEVRQPLPAWFGAEISWPWLICQSVLVVVGGLGGVVGLFTPTAIGILAGLVVTTPVGLLTALPSCVMLLSALLRPRAFYELRPRWRGPGPRPPGPEYR